MQITRLQEGTTATVSELGSELTLCDWVWLWLSRKGSGVQCDSSNRGTKERRLQVWAVAMASRAGWWEVG